jgi:hypothetical protein
VIIAGYLAFTVALAITVVQQAVRPAAVFIPAAVITVAGAGMLAWPVRQPRPAGGPPWWRQQSLLAGWSTGRVWRLSLLLCSVIAASDAASGPHLILIGLLIAGPCCALLTARWLPTAVVGGYALALGVVLGVPDQIFATMTQYAFLAAVAVTAATATAGAVVLQRRVPR